MMLPPVDIHSVSFQKQLSIILLHIFWFDVYRSFRSSTDRSYRNREGKFYGNFLAMKNEIVKSEIIKDGYN
jgi:hypothetical protein